jgi:hypothetical protein
LFFKSIVNRVIVDVVVTDAKGEPVHGLSQHDFSVSEDGQSQRILSFDVHDLDTAAEFPNCRPCRPTLSLTCLARLSQLRTVFGFFGLIFIVKPCVFIVAL